LYAHILFNFSIYLHHELKAYCQWSH